VKALRPLAAAVIAPLVQALARAGVTPNQVTIFGAGLSGLVAIGVALGGQRLAGALVLLAGAFDLLDGALARGTGHTSRFGAFLDSTLDRVTDAALLVGAAGRGWRAGRPVTAILAFLACVASILVSYTRARAEGLGVQGEAGFFDRPARIAVLAGALFLNRLDLGLLLIMLGASATVVQRILFVRRQLED
jgi:CDP-diacylglycerol--glycerol-3-phosphate 3-phosphatidyltransferase